jgi:hypothetical protein
VVAERERAVQRHRAAARRARAPSSASVGAVAMSWPWPARAVRSAEVRSAADTKHTARVRRASHQIAVPTHVDPVSPGHRQSAALRAMRRFIADTLPRSRGDRNSSALRDRRAAALRDLRAGALRDRGAHASVSSGSEPARNALLERVDRARPAPRRRRSLVRNTMPMPATSSSSGTTVCVTRPTTDSGSARPGIADDQVDLGVLGQRLLGQHEHALLVDVARVRRRPRPSARRT